MVTKELLVLLIDGFYLRGVDLSLEMSAFLHSVPHSNCT